MIRTSRILLIILSLWRILLRRRRTSVRPLWRWTAILLRRRGATVPLMLRRRRTAIPLIRLGLTILWLLLGLGVLWLLLLPGGVGIRLLRPRLVRVVTLLCH